MVRRFICMRVSDIHRWVPACFIDNCYNNLYCHSREVKFTMERERAIQVVLALAAVSSDEDDINNECRLLLQYYRNYYQ